MLQNEVNILYCYYSYRTAKITDVMIAFESNYYSTESNTLDVSHYT